MSLPLVLSLSISMVQLASGTADAATLAARASTGDGSPLDAITLGAPIDVTLSVQPEPGESLDTLSLELAWATDRSAGPGPAIGGLALQALPSAVDPLAALSAGADCGDAIGQPFGACTLAIALPAALPTEIASDVLGFRLRYVWQAPTGFALCEVSSADPDCQPGDGGSFGVTALLVAADGSRTGSRFFVTNLGRPGLRVIPEPGPAGLLGLGLMALGARPRARIGRRSSSSPVAAAG